MTTTTDTNEPDGAPAPNASASASPPLRRRSRRRMEAPPSQPARPALTAADWVLVLCLSVAAAWLGWRVFTLGMADSNLANEDPESALAWRPEHPAALVAAANNAFAGHRYDDSRDLARKAASGYPLLGTAYSQLGQYYDFFHREDDALRFFAIASRLAPRDVPARMYMSNHDLRIGKLDAAFDNIDMVLRMYPDLLANVLPSMVQASKYPPAQVQLGRLLRNRPLWRVAFLSLLASSGSDPLAIDNIFGLRGGDDPLPANPPHWGIKSSDPDDDRPTGFTEVDLLINRQVADGRWQVARDTWLNSLNKGQRAVVDLLYDGNFVFRPDYHRIPWLGISSKAFGWQLPDDGAGYDATIGPRTRGATQNSLQVIFNGLPVSYSPVRQLLVLPPGHYRVTGMGQVGGMTNEVGLQWVVACAQDFKQMFLQEPEIVLAHSTPFKGDIPYGPFAFEFDVPAAGGTVVQDGTPTLVLKGCPAQWLRLDLGDGLYKGIPLQGGVLFDHLAVEHAKAK